MKITTPFGSTLLIAVLFAASQAHAQSANTGAGNPAIVDQLARLQTTVDALAAALAGIEGKITTIAAAATDLQNAADTNVRYSPPVFIGQTGTIVCSIANVTDAAHAVKMEVIAGDDGTVKTTLLSDFTLKAGEATVASQQLGRGNWYCRYTVLDGTRSDIRGVAAVFDTAGSTPPFVLLAQ
jgi:hypothetical protein